MSRTYREDKHGKHIKKRARKFGRKGRQQEKDWSRY